MYHQTVIRNIAYAPSKSYILIASIAIFQNYVQYRTKVNETITLESDGLRRHLDVYSLYEFQGASKPCKLCGPVHFFIFRIEVSDKVQTSQGFEKSTKTSNVSSSVLFI